MSSVSDDDLPATPPAIKPASSNDDGGFSGPSPGEKEVSEIVPSQTGDADAAGTMAVPLAESSTATLEDNQISTHLTDTTTTATAGKEHSQLSSSQHGQPISEAKSNADERSLAVTPELDDSTPSSPGDTGGEMPDDPARPTPLSDVGREEDAAMTSMTDTVESLQSDRDENAPTLSDATSTPTSRHVSPESLSFSGVPPPLDSTRFGTETIFSILIPCRHNDRNTTIVVVIDLHKTFLSFNVPSGISRSPRRPPRPRWWACKTRSPRCRGTDTPAPDSSEAGTSCAATCPSPRGSYRRIYRTFSVGGALVGWWW